jgi:hypothetical protein
MILMKKEEEKKKIHRMLSDVGAKRKKETRSDRLVVRRAD